MQGHLMLLNDPMLTNEMRVRSLEIMYAVNSLLRLSARCTQICSHPWMTS